MKLTEIEKLKDDRLSSTKEKLDAAREKLAAIDDQFAILQRRFLDFLDAPESKEHFRHYQSSPSLHPQDVRNGYVLFQTPNFYSTGTTYACFRGLTSAEFEQLGKLCKRLCDLHELRIKIRRQEIRYKSKLKAENKHREGTSMQRQAGVKE